METIVALFFLVCPGTFVIIVELVRSQRIALLVANIDQVRIDVVLGVDIDGTDQFVTDCVLVHNLEHDSTAHEWHLQGDHELLVPVAVLSFWLLHHLSLQLAPFVVK